MNTNSTHNSSTHGAQHGTHGSSTHGSDSIFKIGLNLMGVGLVAGCIVAVANFFTEPMRVQNEITAKNNAKREILPAATTFEEKDGGEYFIGKNEANELVGYVVAVSQKGFDGHIEMMIGIDKDLAVTDYKILKDKETPGLGSKAKEPWFRVQYKGRKVDNLGITKIPNGKDVVAITGSTITSRAISNGVRKGFEKLQSSLESSTNNGGTTNSAEVHHE